MLCDLVGKSALVTGSTGGIGHAIVEEFVASGARVAVNGRSESGVLAAIGRLRARHPDAELVAAPGDVSTARGREDVLATVGRLDILVNNLGIYEPVPALEITDEQWHRMLEVNLLSGVLLAQDVLVPMVERGWGRVLFIASDAGVAIPADMVHYGTSKASVIAAARGLSKAVRGKGVTVNSVIAGPTLTDGVREFVETKLGTDLPWDEAEREFMRTQRASSLLGRFIRPEEVASMVTYLASPLASATTGGAIRVDGGYVDAMLP